MNKYLTDKRVRAGVAAVCVLAVALLAWKQPWRRGPKEGPSVFSEQPGLAMASILNAAVRPVLNEGLGTVQLKDGTYAWEAKTSGTLNISGDLNAQGDLNGDGKNDAAVVLTEKNAKGYALSSVLVFLNKDGEAEYADGVFLGDRVQVESLAIQDGVLTVDYLWHKTGDLLTEPTNPAELKFRLEDGKLTQA